MLFKSNRVLATLAMAVTLGFPLITPNVASAHVITIGYTPGANAGEVNLWLGSYHCDDCGDGPNLEGSARLQGTSVVYDSTTPFTVAEGVNNYTSPAPPPTGLIIGTNLFTSANYCGGTAVASCLNSVYSWEAAVVTGLVAGDYLFTYIPIANPTAHWAPWSDLQSVELTLTTSDIGTGVPEPATIALLGLGLAGVGFNRRRNKKT